jgi:hypothetical protein
LATESAGVNNKIISARDVGSQFTFKLVLRPAYLIMIGDGQKYPTCQNLGSERQWCITAGGLDRLKDHLVWLAIRSL